MAFFCTPSGITKSRSSWPLSATAMKSFQIGSAALPPYSARPRGSLLSKPTYAPATTSGENPTNQTERALFVVPVLPATFLPSFFARCAVPFSTTDVISSLMMKAVSLESTCLASVWFSTRTSPFLVFTFSIKIGGAHMPSPGNIVYAFTKSMGTTSPVPKASVRFAGKDAPFFFSAICSASSWTRSMPIWSRMVMEQVFTEKVRHVLSVMSPRNLAPEFFGAHFLPVHLSKNTFGASVTKREPSSPKWPTGVNCLSSMPRA